MGMFDYVNGPKIDCPKCGKPVEEWQSKDGECELETLELSEVSNFYELCDCGQWIEFFRITEEELEVPGFRRSLP